jgi:hypothetical protein
MLDSPRKVGCLIRLGTTGLFICESDERPRLSRSEAEALLKRCLADDGTMYNLRSLLGTVSGGRPVPEEDQRVVEELAARIENGELLLFGELVPAFAGGGGAAKSNAPVVDKTPPRPARAPAPAPPPPEDTSLFPPGTDLAAMADAVQRASQSGAPFCEH